MRMRIDQPRHHDKTLKIVGENTVHLADVRRSARCNDAARLGEQRPRREPSAVAIDHQRGVDKLPLIALTAAAVRTRFATAGRMLLCLTQFINR